MNWDAIGAIAELTGAVGVMISLVYLGVQIRLNTKQMTDQNRSLRLAALDASASSFSRLRDPIIRDPAVASLWSRALEDFEGLSSDERVQAGAMFQELFFSHQALFNRYAEGAYAEDSWANHLDAIKGQLRSPGIQQWWQRAYRIFDPNFVETISPGSDSKRSVV